MVSVLSGPPASAGGTLLSEMIGVEFGDERQALVRRQIASSQALFRPAARFRCSLKLTSPKWHQLEPTAVGARGRRGPKGSGLTCYRSGTPGPASGIDHDLQYQYLWQRIRKRRKICRVRLAASSNEQSDPCAHGDIPEGVRRACPHFQRPSWYILKRRHSRVINTALDYHDWLDRGPGEPALQTRMSVCLTVHFLALLEHPRLR